MKGTYFRFILDDHPSIQYKSIQSYLIHARITYYPRLGLEMDWCLVLHCDFICYSL